MRENNEELRYYSELFGVGVVVIALETAQHLNDYLDGKEDSIDPDRVDVYEAFSVTYETRLHRWQKSFLDEIDIKNTRDLWIGGGAMGNMQITIQPSEFLKSSGECWRQTGMALNQARLAAPARGLP